MEVLTPGIFRARRFWHGTGCRIVLAALLAVFLTASLPARAQGGDSPVIIRDTEIETILEQWSEPVFRAAGLSPDNVNIILVQNNGLNAFVAGGANIFIYTGLIEKTEGPGELLGVLAHETGHISGGHLITTRAALERASYESIIGVIVGLGAALASGEGGAASAISAGANAVAERRFLAGSRLHESSADQAALTFLEKAEMDPSGLMSFMGKLESEELLPPTQQSEYVRTHPLTRNRIEALQTRGNASPYKGRSFPAGWLDQHARMKAKLTGFINPGQVAWSYDDRDLSLPARYARAIADYRENRVDKALAGMDDLLRMEPDNPYFLELKGQMLVDFGRVGEAVPYYRRSVSLLGKAPLIEIALAHALMESGGNYGEAVKHLENALIGEPRSTRAHRLLATAYGRQGKEALAKLHLAEEAVLQRKFPYAKQQAETALKSFERGSREWIKARDILSYIEEAEKSG